MIAAQRAHERTRNIVATLVLLVVLMLMLLLGWVSGVTSFIMRPSPVESAVEIDDHSFYRTRTGHIVFVPLNGQRCLKVPFSNRTGQIGEGERVACNDVLPQGPPEAGDDADFASRMGAVRNGFTKQR